MWNIFKVNNKDTRTALLLTRWLWMTIIFVIIGRIYRYKVKCNCLGNERHFAAFFIAFLQFTLTVEPCWKKWASFLKDSEKYSWNISKSCWNLQKSFFVLIFHLSSFWAKLSQKKSFSEFTWVSSWGALLILGGRQGRCSFEGGAH